MHVVDIITAFNSFVLSTLKLFSKNFLFKAKNFSRLIILSGGHKILLICELISINRQEPNKHLISFIFNLSSMRKKFMVLLIYYLTTFTSSLELESFFYVFGYNRSLININFWKKINCRHCT